MLYYCICHGQNIGVPKTDCLQFFIYCRYTVLLASRADGTKIKPLVIFKGKRPKKPEAYASGVWVEFSDNGWITESLVEDWLRRAIGCLRLRETVLVWDTYSAHMTESVRERAKSCKTKMVFVPGGCTGLVQPADVSWNKPFKGMTNRGIFPTYMHIYAMIMPMIQIYDIIIIIYFN